MLEMKGVYTATITPFDELGEINLSYVTRHLEFQEHHGVNGVIPCGTNGEGPSLSLAERKHLIEHVVWRKGNMHVIAAAGCVSLAETIELTKFAESAGADAALLLPPFYFPNPAPEGLVSYFRWVLDSVSLPILLYNIPSFTGVEISDELLAGLQDYPHLYGVKDTSGSLDRLERYIRSFPRLKILCGSDDLAEAALKLGAAGSISGSSNVLPELMVEIHRKFFAGEDVSPACRSRLQTAISVQEKVARYKEIFKRYPFAGGNKYALSLRGFPPSLVRPPLVDLTEDQQSSLRSELDAEEFPFEV